jgi:hypothetical protein
MSDGGTRFRPTWRKIPTGDGKIRHFVHLGESEITKNGGKLQLAHLSHYPLHGRGHQRPDPEKGRMKMFGSNIQRQLFAAVAALLVSTMAVSAAVGPAAVSNPSLVQTYA